MWLWRSRRMSIEGVFLPSIIFRCSNFSFSLFFCLIYLIFVILYWGVNMSFTNFHLCHCLAHEFTIEFSLLFITKSKGGGAPLPAALPP